MRTLQRPLALALAVSAAALMHRANAQVNMATTGNYQQNFNGLGAAASNTWSENTTLPNWYWQSGAGSTPLATYVGSTGTGTAGTGYSYGSAAAPADRAMGSICSNTSGAIAYGLLLRNTSGVSITNLTIAYTGEEWRNNGNTTAQNLSFYYRTFTAVSTTLNPFSNASWTNVAALNFTSPIATGTAAALDGNAAANRVVFPATAIPGLTLAANDYILIKWDDPNDTGNDHGLSIDDLTVSWVVNSATPNVGFAPATNTVTEGATQSVNVTMDIAPSSDVTVSVADALTGTASSGSDYTAFTTTTLTFPAVGSYPMTQNVSIATINDPNYEPTETVNLSLTLGSGTANISPNSYQLVVNDNDPLPLVLNEVDYDNPGTDNAEFIEIKNNGITAINLAGFKIELVNGATGGATVYSTITLPNFSLAGGAYYVVGNSNTIPNLNLLVTPAQDLIQNGSPDAIGLRDPSNILLDAVSYEGNSGAPYTEGSGIALANSDGSTAGIGISRFPDGSDTNDNSVDWSAHCLSPGAANLGTSTNCICTPPEATADVQCIDNLTWQITVHVTSTGSGSVVNITNDVNGSSALNAGVGDHILGPFNNNATVNVTVAHESFSLCNLTLSGLFDNCVIDCNGVQGGSALPGTVCDDGDAGTVNDVWSPGCVCAGTPIVPIVGFVLPSSTAGETDVAMTVGLEMDIAPTGPVVVNVSDLFTGTATSGADYQAIGTLQFTFLPSDTYPYLQTFNVLLNDDPDYEPTEIFNLSLSIGSGTAATGTSTFVGIITSEDTPPLKINEVDYDNAGNDIAEWVELKNTGSAPFNIAGFSVQLVNGNLGGAAVYQTIVLPNFTLAGGGYYVIGNSASIPNVNQVVTPTSNLIQNGSPDAIGLRDPFNTLIDAISYEGNTGAPYTEGTGMALADADDNTTVLKTIARYLDGNDTDNNSVDWKIWCATPGASNATVDADADLIADCLDPCPNLAFLSNGNACDDGNVCTINDLVTNCVCAGTFQDTDLDGICDANDPCPALADLQNGDPCDDGDACTINDVVNACVCAGTYSGDTDDDGLCDSTDPCPSLPFLQNGDPCDDGDACTINDEVSSCVCAGTFQDTDSDGTCDANDPCPGLPFLQNGDPCDDGDACTVNDLVSACVCAGTFQDTDGDGVCDANDNCPTVTGQVGSPCNDNNCFTVNDALNASCVCAGTLVPCDTWTLTIETGADGSQINWQIVEAGGPCVLASGGPYANNVTATPTFCVPQGGCFNLTFTDDANGIAGGGWKLVDNNGRRILDNMGNGGCFSGSSTNPLSFCNEPASAQTIIVTQCDKENWIMSDVIIASANPAVSAQYGIGDQTDDGYQFWFQNPCGGYSRRIFRNHATSGGQGPANALRASKLALSTMVTNPLPVGELLNVRVRARVNGVDGAWGPACRFRLDPSACTLTQLNNFNSSPNYSCGVSGKVVGAGGNTGKIFANVVTSGGAYATHYRFEFSVAGEGYLRNVVSTNAVCVLGVWQTNPLLCGTYTYDVRVQASFNGGVSYCPFGPSCTVGITNSQPAPYCTTPGGSMMEQTDTRIDQNDGGDFAMYPNPNDGSRLFLQMGSIADDVTTISVDIYDAMGKRASTRTLPVSGSAINTVIQLDGELTDGLYFVTITSGKDVRTERLVIQ